MIGLIYEGPLEPVPWQQSLNAMRERLHANYVILVLRPSTPDDSGFMVTAGNVTTQAVVSYSTNFYALDPFVGLPPDQIVTVHEILGEARWLESAYYKEYNAPYDVFHVMGGPIFTRPMVRNADCASAVPEAPKSSRKMTRRCADGCCPI
ncbi:hypothetical protein ACFS07_20850 [Undibacterium arcticum]